MNKKQKKVLKRIIIASISLIVITAIWDLIIDSFFPNQNIILNIVKLIIYLIPYYIIGNDILKKALKGIKNKQVFDENFLMAVATLGALALGEYSEAVAVMLFYQIGELFQSYAVGKSRENITALMDIRPDYANVEADGEMQTLDPDEVAVGTIIVVKPGEKVPIDGIVVSGESSLDTSALTGESLPRTAKAGEEILSGCINLSGLLRIKTTHEFGESTVSKILDLVENASSRKSRSEEFIAKFAKYYTPIVCYLAMALAILPPVVLGLYNNFTAAGTANPFNWGMNEWSAFAAGFTTWIYRALTFLVISCPCALVISIPLSFFGGIGGASREGILVKGSNYLEALSKIDTVVFDKTGTVTQGVFKVSRIVTAKDSHFSEKQILEIAAKAESYSSHPISNSLKQAYKEQLLDNSIEGAIENYQEISGKGIAARVDRKEVLVGNDKLMTAFGISFEQCQIPGTVVHVAVAGAYAGYILISDELKQNSELAIKALKGMGNKTVMLTGDREAAAVFIANTLGIDEYHAELLPGDKVDQVERLLNERNKNGMLAFVGDGINDAPVLTRADVGIAMGALGADAAIEAADVVLMDDDPLKISKAIRIAKKCMRICYENIYFAIGIKIICLLLGALGIANMWIAIFADVGVMVIAVLNAVRALNTKNV